MQSGKKTNNESSDPTVTELKLEKLNMPLHPDLWQVTLEGVLDCFLCFAKEIVKSNT